MIGMENMGWDMGTVQPARLGVVCPRRSCAGKVSHVRSQVKQRT